MKIDLDKKPHRFIYKREKPTSLKVLGIIAALFGFGGLAYTPVFGVVMLVAASGLLLYQRGIELDLGAGRYRLITAIGGQGFGNWEPLPALKCVSVFKTKFTSRTYGRSNASVTSSDEVVQVNLVTADDKRLLVFESNNTAEACTFAQAIAAKLNQKIWDATEREGKWLA